jgi:hypothetical protein
MYGSGVVIGMAITVAVVRQILKGLQQDRTVFCGAAVGTTARGTAVLRLAAAAAPTTVTATAVFVWFLSHDSVGGYLAMPASLPCEIRSKFHRAKSTSFNNAVNNECNGVERI